jgi:hypothetical protein
VLATINKEDAMTGIKGLKELFKAEFIRPQVGDRVMNKDTRQLATVLGKSQMKGSFKVYTITVQYDNGSVSAFTAENEFIKIGRS